MPEARVHSCRRLGPSSSQQFRARFKDDRAWQFVSIACVMVDQLQELAAALLAAP